MDSPISRIYTLAQSCRTISALLILGCAKFIPAFDSSASLAAGQPVNGTTADLGVLRWDAIHFLSIARHGYTHEQQLAFQPLWPMIMRVVSIPFTALREYPARRRYMNEHGGTFRWGVEPEVRDTVLSGAMVAMGAFILAAIMLYRLTKLYFPSKLAYRTTLLYCLAPTPAVLSSPYTEPIYALATFSGLYFILTKRSLAGAACLAAATATRATGVFMAPVAAALIWQAYPHTLDTRAKVSRAIKAAGVGVIVVAPFLAFQAYAFLAFCLPVPARPWCSGRMLPYSYVQSEYWGVGFLHYWTPLQIPNILLALPVLYISFRGSLRFFSSLSSSTGGDSAAVRRRPIAPPMWPLQAHHLVMTLLLLFSSHTQIALRVISGDPTFWWNLMAMAYRPCPSPNHAVPLDRKANVKRDLAVGGEKEVEVPVNAKAGAAAKVEGEKAKENRDIRDEAHGADEEGLCTGNGGLDCVKLTRTGRAWVYWAVIWGSVSIVLWAGHYPPA